MEEEGGNADFTTNLAKDGSFLTDEESHLKATQGKHPNAGALGRSSRTQRFWDDGMKKKTVWKKWRENPPHPPSLISALYRFIRVSAILVADKTEQASL